MRTLLDGSRPGQTVFHTLYHPGSVTGYVLLRPDAVLNAVLKAIVDDDCLRIETQRSSCQKCKNEDAGIKILELFYPIFGIVLL